MGIICLRFKFRPNKEVDEILGKVGKMEEEAVQWLIDNNKTSLKEVHKALYTTFRQRYPELHSHWVNSALKTATGIVHIFNKRRRKGKAKKPNLRKFFVILSPCLYRVSFTGKYVRLEISKSPRDLEPIVLWFKPHHKYRNLLEMWKSGKCKMGQITLTRNSISIPLKFSDPPIYQPQTIIGIDSNENSLDYFNIANEKFGAVDTSEIARINRDYDRRIQKAMKGKHNPRFKKKIQRKYGFLRKERTKTLWHSIALMFIQMALNQQAALVLENLNGMKGRIKNTSKRLRQRLLNYWNIITFHRILEMKARLYGVPLIFVDPTNTSKSCPVCGGCLRGQDKRCPSCGLSRHYVAAINIARRGLEKFPSLSWLGQGSVGDPRCPSSSDTLIGCHYDGKLMQSPTA